MARTSKERPCVVIPQVQIDAWSHRAGTVVKDKQYAASDLARELFTNHASLLSSSLLKSQSATTVVRLARCIKMVSDPISPHITSGQIYLRDGWRVRWDDMSATLQDMVSNGAYDNRAQLLQEFKVYYDAEKLTSDIYRVIGPARSAGVRSVLPWVDGVVE